ncbi:hypothetical protein ACH5RR_005093 [Cinchona calisaya]|uniref:Uncharacterized protein n=1 Tax=Cinchona calisaya TaxID=153742 RepID=A0ABD3AZD6_9GENT
MGDMNIHQTSEMAHAVHLEVPPVTRELCWPSILTSHVIDANLLSYIMRKHLKEHCLREKIMQNHLPFGNFQIAPPLFFLPKGLPRIVNINHVILRQPSVLHMLSNETKRIYRKEAILRWKKKKGSQ